MVLDVVLEKLSSPLLFPKPDNLDHMVVLIFPRIRI